MPATACSIQVYVWLLSYPEFVSCGMFLHMFALRGARFCSNFYNTGKCSDLLQNRTDHRTARPIKRGVSETFCKKSGERIHSLE